MSLDLSTFLRAAQSIGPVLTQLPAVRSILDAAVDLLGSKPDQDIAKEALADLIADNDDGHRRLQEKLEKLQYAETLAAAKG